MGGISHQSDNRGSCHTSVTAPSAALVIFFLVVFFGLVIIVVVHPVKERATVNDEGMVISFFNLKGDGEKLNIKKTYFPLCHPSFLRRLIFQLEEVTPVTHRYWGSSYGSPAGVKTIKKIIDTGPNDIIIVEPDEMGVRGYDIDSDLEAMLEFTNLQEILAKA